jgi:hypothetical protein
MATEHRFVAHARAATSDPSAHAHVAAVMADLEARLAAALACEREAARTELPATLVAIQRDIGALVARSLLPGYVWADAAHQQLYQRAVTLFGVAEATQRLGRPPEALVLPTRSGGAPPSRFR